MRGHTVNGSMEIHAPADVVWNLLVDVESYPITFRNVDSVLTLSRKSIKPVEPGAKYSCKITVEGRKFDLITRATQVDTSDPSRRVYVYATSLWKSTGTSTTIVEVISPSICRVTISYGMIPDGWYGKVYLGLFRKRIERDGEASIKMDLADITQRVASLASHKGEHGMDTSSVTEASNVSV